MNPLPYQISSDDMDKIFKILEQLRLTQRPYFCYVRVMLETGVRLHEVLSLNPASSIDGETGKITVYSPRTMSTRIVWVRPELARALKAFLTRYPTVKPSAFSYTFNKVAAHYGLPHVKLHHVRLFGMLGQPTEHADTKPADPA
jgi:integrase